MSCPDCFNGAIHEGTPTGTVTKLHGLDVYVAEPASGDPAKGIIGRCDYLYILYIIVHMHARLLRWRGWAKKSDTDLSYCCSLDPRHIWLGFCKHPVAGRPLCKEKRLQSLRAGLYEG